MELLRNQDGSVVHKPDCQFNRSGRWYSGYLELIAEIVKNTGRRAG